MNLWKLQKGNENLIQDSNVSDGRPWDGWSGVHGDGEQKVETGVP